jgi:hypothetical protein
MKNIFYILNIAAAVASNATSVEQNIANYFATHAKMTGEQIFEAYKEQSGEHPLAKILSGKKLSPELGTIKGILDECRAVNNTSVLTSLGNINSTSEDPNAEMKGNISHHATSSAADLLRFILTLGFMPADTTIEQAEDIARKMFFGIEQFGSAMFSGFYNFTEPKTLEKAKSEISAMHALVKDEIFTYFPRALSNPYVDLMRAIPTLSETNLNSLATLKMLSVGWAFFELAGIAFGYNNVGQAMYVTHPGFLVKETKEKLETLHPNTSLVGFFSMLEINPNLFGGFSAFSFDRYDFAIKLSFFSRDSRSILMSLKTVCELYGNKTLSKYKYSDDSLWNEKLFKLDEKQLETLASYIANLPFDNKKSIDIALQNIRQHIDSM